MSLSRFLTASVALALLLPGAAAAQPRALNGGPFIVFFDWDRTNLTAEATVTLDNMLREWRGVPGICYIATGHTDRAGSARYNMQRSQRMALAVASYLYARGVPGTAVTTIARGETQNLVPTADGVREGQNRRVEVMVGPCR